MICHSTCQLSCDVAGGYYLDGPSLITCTKTGEWDEETSRCFCSDEETISLSTYRVSRATLPLTPGTLSEGVLHVCNVLLGPWVERYLNILVLGSRATLQCSSAHAHMWWCCLLSYTHTGVRSQANEITWQITWSSVPSQAPTCPYIGDARSRDWAAVTWPVAGSIYGLIKNQD